MINMPRIMFGCSSITVIYDPLRVMVEIIESEARLTCMRVGVTTLFYRNKPDLRPTDTSHLLIGRPPKPRRLSGRIFRRDKLIVAA